MRPSLLFVFLLVFWVLLSGESGFLLFSGILFVSLITLLSIYLGIADGEGMTLSLLPGFIAYMPWFLWQVVLSSIDVALRILNPNLPILPSVATINVHEMQPPQLMLYAHSVTLTPGTVSVYINQTPPQFLVHSIASEPIEDLLSGRMESKVLRTSWWK